MADLTRLDWFGIIIGYFGLAGIALWFLDRSHRSAIDKLTKAYQDNRADQQILIDVLQMLLDQVRRDLYGVPDEAEKNHPQD